MPRPMQTLAWREFGGLFDGLTAEAEQGQAARLENLYRDRGVLRRRGGRQLVAQLSPSAIPVDGLASYRIAGTDYLVAAHNGRLVNVHTGTELPNSAGKVAVGQTVTSALIDGQAYFGDGTNQNVRHNGSTTMQVISGPPATAPTLTEFAAGNLNGDYRYLVTFFHHNPPFTVENIFSAAGPVSETISVTNKSVLVSNVPLHPNPTAENVRGRTVWRTKNAGNEFFFSEVLDDNTTTSYIDNKADGDLGLPLAEFLGVDLQNVRFPPCKYLITHQNRLVGAGCNTSEGDKQTVYVSNYRAPWYCPIVPDITDPTQGARFPLQGPAAGEITGLGSHGTQIFVFTLEAAFVLVTSDQLADYVLHKFANHGCVSHASIVSVKDRIIWASSDGIYMAQERGGLTRISEDVQLTYRSISEQDLAKSSAFVFDDRYYFIWPQGTLVFDLKYGIWSRNTNFAFKATVVEGSGSARRAYAAEMNAARIFRIENGPDDNGLAIPVTWSSHDFDCGMAGREKRLFFVNAHFKKGLGQATLSLYRETQTSPIQQVTHDISQGEGVVSKLEARCVEQARGERFRIEISHPGTGSEFQLLQAEVLFNQVT